MVIAITIIYSLQIICVSIALKVHAFMCFNFSPIKVSSFLSVPTKS